MLDDRGISKRPERHTMEDDLKASRESGDSEIIAKE